MTTNKSRQLIAAVSLASAFLLTSGSAIAGYDLVELDDIQQHDDYSVTETTITNYQTNTTTDTGSQAVVQEQTITLTLNGATNYESVEIFHRLLQNIDRISSLEREAFHIAPGDPQSSKATWKITTTDQDPFAIETEMNELIRNLDPLVANEILIGLSFTPTSDDIATVKEIKPYSATASSLLFTSGTSVPVQYRANYRSDDYSPELYQGFD